MSADGGHFGPRSGSLKTILAVDNMAWMVLKWSIFKIVSGDPDLHPRWPPSADIL
jgi:predicted NUDIX family NTP pyrophosphohydrolase